MYCYIIILILKIKFYKFYCYNFNYIIYKLLKVVMEMMLLFELYVIIGIL